MTFERTTHHGGGSKIPCSLTTEEVLERFLNELKHPINSIKGYTLILQKPSYREQHQEAITNIIRVTQQMEELRALVNNYLQECLDR